MNNRPKGKKRVISFLCSPCLLFSHVLFHPCPSLFPLHVILSLPFFFRAFPPSSLFFPCPVFCSSFPHVVSRWLNLYFSGNKLQLFLVVILQWLPDLCVGGLAEIGKLRAVGKSASRPMNNSFVGFFLSNSTHVRNPFRGHCSHETIADRLCESRLSHHASMTHTLL